MSDYVSTIKGQLLLGLYEIELGSGECLMPTSDIAEIVKRNNRRLRSDFTKATHEYIKSAFVELESDGLVESTSYQLNLKVPEFYRDKRLTEKGKAVASVLKKAIDEINIMLK